DRAGPPARAVAPRRAARRSRRAGPRHPRRRRARRSCTRVHRAARFPRARPRAPARNTRGAARRGPRARGTPGLGGGGTRVTLMRGALLVAGKDLRIETRSRVALQQILPFGGIVVVLFAF